MCVHVCVLGGSAARQVITLSISILGNERRAGQRIETYERGMKGRRGAHKRQKHIQRTCHLLHFDSSPPPPPRPSPSAELLRPTSIILFTPEINSKSRLGFNCKWGPQWDLFPPRASGVAHANVYLPLETRAQSIMVMNCQ